MRDKVGKFYSVGEKERHCWVSGRGSKQSQVSEAMEREKIYKLLQQTKKLLPSSIS